MTVYIALLRGINVGGNKKVGMAELKRMFETLGLGRVQTYINSGNVLFESEEAAGTLGGRIEREIETVFGFPVSVILRSVSELERAIAANPFADEGSPEELNLHAGFMAEIPTPEKLNRIQPYVNEEDQYRIAGFEIYLMFRAGVGNSKLANNLSKLGVPVTLRNWNTTNKLFALAKAMEN